LFVGDAWQVLADAPIDRIWYTYTVPLTTPQGALGERVTVVPTGPPLAEAIRRLNRDGAGTEHAARA
jgi:phosphoribosylpyrophosphate synthetase